MKRRSILMLITGLFFAVITPTPNPYGPASGSTILISVSSEGVQGNGASSYVSISADGRYAVFESYSDNLTSEVNASSGIFLRDLQAGKTMLITRGYDGQPADMGSSSPSISADGRLIAFSSFATNLVPNDQNSASDVFLYDRDTDEDGMFDEPGQVSMARISVSSSGQEGHGGEADSIFPPSISADNRYVAFQSAFTNLVVDDHNNAEDIFLHDRTNGKTIRVSVASNGAEGNQKSSGPHLSADGRFVVFQSYASNLVANDTNNTCDLNYDGDPAENCPDIFLHDRDTDGDGIFDEAEAIRTTLVSVASDGSQANYFSDPPPMITADGRFIVFSSYASNLASGDTNGRGDVFLHDRQTGETRLISISLSGSTGNGFSYLPSISPDGRFVAFASAARNLVAGDFNDKIDIFVRDLYAGRSMLASIHTSGTLANGPSFYPYLWGTDGTVAFQSEASNLVDSDTNGNGDVFLREIDWPSQDHKVFLPAIR